MSVRNGNLLEEQQNFNKIEKLCFVKSPQNQIKIRNLNYRGYRIDVNYSEQDQM
jgi:hypothetical protein